MVHSANEEGHVHGLPNVASTGVRERLASLLKLPHVATRDAPHLVLGRPNHGMVVVPRLPDLAKMVDQTRKHL